MCGSAKSSVVRIATPVLPGQKRPMEHLQHPVRAPIKVTKIIRLKKFVISTSAVRIQRSCSQASELLSTPQAGVDGVLSVRKVKPSRKTIRLVIGKRVVWRKDKARLRRPPKTS